MSAIVNYSSATGQYSLIIVGSGNPSWIWSKWYQGPTEPDVADANPVSGVAPGATTWQTQISNSGSQVYGPQFVAPAAGNGVKLVVWELQADGSTFVMSSAWEPPHSPSSKSGGSASQSSSAHSSSNSSAGHAAPSSPSSSASHSGGAPSSPSESGIRAANPNKKRRDDDVVPCEVAAE